MSTKFSTLSLSIVLFLQNSYLYLPKKIERFFNGLPVCNIASNKEARAVKDFVDSLYLSIWKDRSTPPVVFLGKDFLKICSKFRGGHPY